LSSAARSVSASRTTIEFWNVPANMFPFANALAYPNIGRRVIAGETGTALSKVATSSGDVFFQVFTVVGLYRK
jgi:hypothetical protein